MEKRWAPACCASNATLGFALAIEYSEREGCVYGSAFQIAIVGADGITHYRRAVLCPLCDKVLSAYSCAEIDAWRGCRATERAVYQVQAALRKIENNPGDEQ